jgi:hypothetical protein
VLTRALPSLGGLCLVNDLGSSVASDGGLHIAEMTDHRAASCRRFRERGGRFHFGSHLALSERSRLLELSQLADVCPFEASLLRRVEVDSHHGDVGKYE